MRHVDKRRPYIQTSVRCRLIEVAASGDPTLQSPDVKVEPALRAGWLNLRGAQVPP